MRIVLIGQAAFGRAVLERIHDGGKDTVAGVFAPPDTPGRGRDPLAEAAAERGIRVEQHARLRSPRAVQAFAGLEPDLCVMAFVTDIVPLAIIQAPRLGTIQYHPSLLPLHRGPSSINWAIINGDTRTGLTVFWPDAGLDTGPVLLQRETEIGPDDTVGSVYFNRLFPMGVDAILEAIDLVREGEAPRTTQDESRATYESHCTDADGAIDWRRTAGELHNLIRGCDPQPGAHTTHAGATVRLYGSTALPASDAAPGTVIAVSDEGVQVAASDGAILIARMRPAGAGKSPAAEAAAAIGLRSGDRLGT